MGLLNTLQGEEEGGLLRRRNGIGSGLLQVGPEEQESLDGGAGDADAVAQELRVPRQPRPPESAAEGRAAAAVAGREGG